MKATGILIIALLLCAFSSVLADPVLTLSTNTIDFGAVRVDSTEESSITVSNDGDATLQITLITITGLNSANFSGILLPFSLDPTQDTTLVVSFTPSDTGSFSASLNFVSNGGNASVDLLGTGIAPIMRISPTTLDFDSVRVGIADTLLITITNTGNITLQIDSLAKIGSDTANFDAIGTIPMSLAPGGIATLGVSFEPDNTGSFSASLRFFSDSFGGDSLVALQGVGVEPVLSAMPSFILFGNVRVNSTKGDTITFYNQGTATLHVTQIQVDPPFSIDPDTFSVSPGDSAKREVLFTPPAVQTFQRVLSIQSDGGNAQITLHGSGVQPIMAVTPLMINFGKVPLDSTKTDSVQIINAGTDTLRVTQISIGGSHPQRFSVSSDTLLLPPGRNRFRKVDFTPDDTLSFNATLNIDSDGGSAAISLSGAGVGPKIEISVDTIDYGEVHIGDTATAALQIYNVGSDTLHVTQITISGTDPTNFQVDNTPFTLLPAGSETREVRFTPDLLKNFSAMLNLTSDGGDTSITLLGEGVLPALSVSPLFISFGNVEVDSAETRNLAFSNQGTGILLIDRIRITGPDSQHFSIDTASITLLPSQNLSRPVLFMPTQAGNLGASIEIRSNGGDRTVSLSGNGVRAPQANFQAVPTPGTVTFRNTFTDMSIPGTSAIASRTWKFGDGSDTTYTGFAQTITHTYLAGGSYTAVLTVSDGVLADSIQKLVQAYPTPTIVQIIIDPDTIIYKQDVEVRATVSAAAPISSVTLRYAKSAKGSGFSSPVIMENISGSTYRATVPGAFIDEQALKFFIEVIDNFGLRNVPDTIFKSVTVPAGALTRTLPKDQWLMFSLPFNSSNKSIGAILSSLGPESDTRWKIFRTRPSGVGRECYNLGELNGMGEYGRFEPGNAFWLYLKEVDSQQLSFPQMETIQGDLSVTDTLQVGWNQIGNPYAFPISWDENVENSAGLQPFRFDGAGLVSDQMDTSDFELQPWNGYAVFNDTTFKVAIRYSPQGKPGAPRPLPKINPESDWKILLTARTANRYAKTVAGMAAQAQPEKDPLDYAAPPVMGEDFVSMFFHHPDWDSRVADYSSDFRPHHNDGATWQLTIVSSARSVKLRPEWLEKLPENFRAAFYDSKYGTTWPLEAGSEIALLEILPQEENRFALLIGTEPYINGELGKMNLLLPREFRLLQNYPNPFNPETFIAYQLPEAGRVTLAIYNLLGQVVKILVDEHQEAGFYKVRWDGANNAGGQTASGVYFYRLRSAKHTQTLKMLKIQ